jgi:Spy/CpxP family protein refolding chaperone
MFQTARLKALFAVAAVVLLAGMTVAVMAQNPPAPPSGPGGRPLFGRGPMGGPGFGPGLPLGQLGLSEAQLSQVREIRKSFQPQMMTVLTALRTAHQAWLTAVETLPVDQTALHTASEAVGTATGNLAAVQAQVDNQIYALLTPDQQAKLKDIEARHSARAGQGGRRPKL